MTLSVTNWAQCVTQTPHLSHSPQAQASSVICVCYELSLPTHCSPSELWITTQAECDFNPPLPQIIWDLKDVKNHPWGMRSASSNPSSPFSLSTLSETLARSRWLSKPASCCFDFSQWEGQQCPPRLCQRGLVGWPVGSPLQFHVRQRGSSNRNTTNGV